MKDDLQSHPEAFTVSVETSHQFRLVRLQVFNWGTFNGLHDVPIAKAGYLFVGPSGSGKSSGLDGHAVLLTPPKWLDFNVAAREGEKKQDRNLATYIRGAWAEQTNEAGNYAVQYLRTGTTWSSLAATYENGSGKVVVLAQVMWLRGNATSTNDVKRWFMVFERSFDLKELEFFADSDFDVRKLRQQFPESLIREEFSAYFERFKRLLNIDSELALRLLHKTQSAKNLGDLNVFLRDFMLDEPKTFEVARRLVDEFGELNEAHQAVVTARKQIQALEPIEVQHIEFQRMRDEHLKLRELDSGLDRFREHKRKELLEARITELNLNIAVAGEVARQKKAAFEQEDDALQTLEARRLGLGGDRIKDWERQLAESELQKTDRLQKRAVAAAAYHALGWVLPDSATAFTEHVDAARRRLEVLQSKREADDDERLALREKRQQLEGRFSELKTEIAAMERQPSNIRSEMLRLRDDIAANLGVAPSRLPFAGELLEVKPEAAVWRGAIEKVLRPLAMSLVVEERLYNGVSGYLDKTFTGRRLVYLRMTSQGKPTRAPAMNSLVLKIGFKRDPMGDWVRDEVKTRFDYECVESLQAFRQASRAITRAGQVKHSESRHEKDDRYKTEDRANWVLGFDNSEKLKLYRDDAAEVGGQLADTIAELEKLTERQRDEDALKLHCQTLVNMQWHEVDVATALTRIQLLTDKIAAEKSGNTALAQLEAQISRQKEVYDRAKKARDDAESEQREQERALKTATGKLEQLKPELLAVRVTAFQQVQLTERFERTGRTVSDDNLDPVTLTVQREIAKELEELVGGMATARAAIETGLAEFIKTWPAEAAGLDAQIESAEDFFAKLRRLKTDDLPRHEERFFQMLREQSDQNLSLLSSQLDQERKLILERLELVNASLGGAEFGEGTYLSIDATERSLTDVTDFKQNLKRALSNAYADDARSAEERFAALNVIVKRLSGQDVVDKAWRDLVLDVRRHVEFVGIEQNAAGEEVEIYRSGAGKSGGQRQKLAATCLAAALRYQLGGEDTGVPTYSTVVLDEAFDKADPEFTTMAMNIFKTFGFQMIVATPLKSVMTLEPFIGGACFVQIRDRRHSGLLMIDYDEDTRRLKLPNHRGDADDAEGT